MYMKPVRRMLVQYDKSGLDMNAIATMPMLQVGALSTSFFSSPFCLGCGGCSLVVFMLGLSEWLYVLNCILWVFSKQVLSLCTLTDGSEAQYVRDARRPASALQTEVTELEEHPGVHLVVIPPSPPLDLVHACGQ